MISLLLFYIETSYTIIHYMYIDLCDNCFLIM